MEKKPLKDQRRATGKDGNSGSFHYSLLTEGWTGKKKNKANRRHSPRSNPHVGPRGHQTRAGKEKKGKNKGGKNECATIRSLS